MKTLIAVLIAAYSVFVLIVGTTAQKGMLLAVLVLSGIIILFYKYSFLARSMMKRYDELKRAIYTADTVTNFIEQLENKKTEYEGKNLDPGVEVNHALGILKRARLRAGYTEKEDISEDVIRPNDSQKENT
jgi:hypothetical protein